MTGYKNKKQLYAATYIITHITNYITKINHRTAYLNIMYIN